MHRVLRNEIIFLVTFVWPLAIPLSLLLARLARERATRVPARAPGRGTKASGALLVVLLVTGIGIFYHPGWTAGYFRLIDVHVRVGYPAWLAYFTFVAVYLRLHRPWKTTLLVLTLVLLSSATAMLWNEVNFYVFLEIPRVAAGALVVRALPRDLGAAAHEAGMRAGLAVL